ncbi:hypothetical protein D3C78_854500 [compost metagenome]
MFVRVGQSTVCIYVEIHEQALVGKIAGITNVVVIGDRFAPGVYFGSRRVFIRHTGNC